MDKNKTAPCVETTYKLGDTTSASLFLCYNQIKILTISLFKCNIIITINAKIQYLWRVDKVMIKIYAFWSIVILISI